MKTLERLCYVRSKRTVGGMSNQTEYASHGMKLLTRLRLQPQERFELNLKHANMPSVAIPTCRCLTSIFHGVSMLTDSAGLTEGLENVLN